MKAGRDGLHRFRYLVLLWIAGCVALSCTTWACFQLGLNLATTGFVCLIVIVMLSLWGSFVSSAIFSALGAAYLNYYFTPPIFSFQVQQAQDLVGLVTFLIASIAVTALVRHVRRLEAAQREQVQLLDLSHDAVFVRDMDATITYWNRGAEALYGWGEDQAIGAVAHQLLRTRFTTPLAEITETLSRTGSWEGELLRHKQDGSEVVVASRWSLQRNESGQPFSMLETNNDITERKRAEDALRRSEEACMAEAQQLSLTGSFGWNTTNGELFWSEQSFRIFEYDPGATPTLDLVFRRVHPDDLAQVQQVIDRAARDRQDFDFEYRLLMPDGSVKHLHVVAHAVTAEPSRLDFVGAIMDVTAAKRGQEQLHEVQAELAHVTRVTTLGELSASVAHEVAQPLSAIVTDGEACLRWLGRGTPQLEEVQACVKRMIDDGKRAREIVKRIRALAKRATPQKTSLKLDEVVHDVVPLIQREISSHRVALHLKLDSDLPPLLGDRVQLQQVVINLVMNGVQAMEGVDDGPRELLIESRRDGDGHVILSVRDSGTGIDPENARRMFDAFFTTKSNGMGMGLSICRSIIEAHGGRMWASSNAGRGTTVQCSLPTMIESAT